ncbi:ComF family protein [Streptococcus sp. DD11]|uniref:ComF family protein n=1 Tax=Streptococcus sp. DD11 TaxID=1777879 RepID=UPI000AE580D1|nr:ComF family protein [Streptococcus sp. DD11]
MKHCLLCSSQLKERLTFSQFFLLKPEKPRICSSCFENFEQITDQHCPGCCRKGSAEICSDCQSWSREGYQVQHFSCFTYNQAMKDYFSQYKFQGDYLLRFVFRETVREKMRAFKDYLAVPVPVSPEKFRHRGFNQVEGILDGAGIAYKNILEKRDTVAQSSKNREERLQTQQCFSIKEDQHLPEKIILIDDIYTTGKTLQLAKQILLEAGVKEILTFSIAR